MPGALQDACPNLQTVLNFLTAQRLVENYGRGYFSVYARLWESTFPELGQN